MCKARRNREKRAAVKAATTTVNQEIREARKPAPKPEKERTFELKELHNIGILSIEFDPECGNIPIAIVGDLDTKEELTYLTPFRKYAFQCSCDRKGHGDAGSTQVFGIMNVLNAISPNDAPTNLYWTTTQLELLKAMASSAVQHFACRRDLIWNPDHGQFSDTVKKPLSNGRLTENWAPSMLDRFIAESVIWVTGNKADAWTRENNGKMV